MERPSDRRTALPAAPVAGIPRWRALLAGGIRRLVMGGTGLLAALAALLALAQIVCLALCLLALVILALCFLLASYPEECRQFWRMLRETAMPEPRGGRRGLGGRPLRKGKAFCRRTAGKKKTTRSGWSFLSGSGGGPIPWAGPHRAGWPSRAGPAAGCGGR